MTRQLATVSERRGDARKRRLSYLLLATVAIVAVPAAPVVPAPAVQIDDRASDRRDQAAAAPTTHEHGSSADVFWAPPVPLTLAAAEQSRREALPDDAAATLYGVFPFELSPRPPPIHAHS